jgi:hypothetical protein
MDELTLLNKLKSLDIRWSLLDGWLKFWILLVVIGVCVELVVILVEYFEELHDFRRGILHAPDSPSRRLLFFALLGAGLVAFGVAGEFGVHIKAGRVETDMRDTTSSLVAIVDAKTEQLRRNNLLLQNAVLELKEKIADRRLSPQQRHRIRSKMLTMPIPQKWQAITFAGDGEAKGLESDIETTLVGKGGVSWPAPVRLQDELSIPVRGIFIEMGRGASAGALKTATRLANSLRAERLGVTGPEPFSEFKSQTKAPFLFLSAGAHPDPNTPITIIIGRKP